MKYGVQEATRLLKLAYEKNHESAELAVKAINALAKDNPSMPLKWALLHVNNALPGAALSEKEKELLKVSNG
jgi:hypothetical protein